VIFFKRGYAGRELIPSSTRPATDTLGPPDKPIHSLASTVSPLGHLSQFDVLDHCYDMDTTLDISEIALPTNPRFTTTAYIDA
jgi:hypothetical protein